MLLFIVVHNKSRTSCRGETKRKHIGNHYFNENLQYNGGGSLGAYLMDNLLTDKIMTLGSCIWEPEQNAGWMRGILEERRKSQESW